MEFHGWGRYPRIEADAAFPLTPSECAGVVQRADSLIARGLGRSYGDSSLASHLLDTHRLDHFLAFDESTGALTCAAGASLDEILRLCVPRGWFLPVTPGTRFVTLGGAIASDVHGKNHHVDGSFGDHVAGMELLLGNGERVVASRTENPDLFHATCGGMGLTGVILTATLSLRPIRSSDIIETTIKAPDLDAILAAFEENAAAPYSVAWIDCLARGRQLGRSLLMLGEHAGDGPLTVQAAGALPVPFDMPAGLLNHATIRTFNTLYYGKALHARHTRRIAFEPFFYPLDKLAHWNRLYGRPGFVQYQFVLPADAGAAGLRDVLERIAASGRGSFLAVLKVFGKGNANLLSFPRGGFTLALDFKAESAAFQLMDELDKIVLGYGGRLYLAKDARMSEATFKAGYPRWQEFEEVRGRYHAIGKFASIQSRRLGLQ
ncbi:MAG: decaprenylphospho-beta-D-ribofuranose 2-oxidase [Pseudomonadota bacterium]|nr:decaprenylphospho-beta-D-ribofuranose 2-oxidase [Pseudomonadota bacterium]